MPKKAPPNGFESIKHEELSRLFGRVTMMRLAAVPLMAVMVVWLLLVPVTPWRRAVLVALGVLAGALFIHEVWRHRRHGLGRRAFALNFAFATIGQAAVSLATGGIESPFFFVMFPIGMVIAVVVEAPLAFILIAVQVAEIWLMAWVKVAQVLPHLNPAWLGGEAAPGWDTSHLMWSAAFASVGMLVVAFLGRSIRASFEGMVSRGLEAREEVLRAYRDRAHELAALSGEIAHELKNPLASIKGLSALLAHDAPAGKMAERLQVMRGEIDRMQGILEGFLNFSRPLVPLALEAVALDTVLAEVAYMHEGIADERRIRLRCKREGQTIRCDPRKIKQAIINLVQNAIDASPAGTEVELAARGRGPVFIEVLDRGPGVAPAVAGNEFEPGVTSKPNGSGLGLTIARALARQHGGDLTLSSRAGGGTVASIRLPGEDT